MTEITRVFVKDLVPEPDWESYGEDEAVKKLVLNNWSNDLMRTGSEHSVYRQCSLGWHGECSQREHWGPDCECNCLCHIEPREFDFDPWTGDSIAEDVNRVSDYEGRTWIRKGPDNWRQLDTHRELDTNDLLRRFGHVTEIFEKDES